MGLPEVCCELGCRVGSGRVDGAGMESRRGCGRWRGSKVEPKSDLDIDADGLGSVRLVSSTASLALHRRYMS